MSKDDEKDIDLLIPLNTLHRYEGRAHVVQWVEHLAKTGEKFTFDHRVPVEFALQNFGHAQVPIICGSCGAELKEPGSCPACTKAAANRATTDVAPAPVTPSRHAGPALSDLCEHGAAQRLFNIFFWGELGEEMWGDLEEEIRVRIHPRHGSDYARRWLRLQVVKTVAKEHLPTVLAAFERILKAFRYLSGP